MGWPCAPKIVQSPGVSSSIIASRSAPAIFASVSTEVSSYELNIDTIYSLEGETKMGEQFEEFYPDKDALKRLMFELFYNEVEP